MSKTPVIYIALISYFLFATFSHGSVISKTTTDMISIADISANEVNINLDNVIVNLGGTTSNLVEGIRNTADFDWSSTNINNSKSYFENSNNFFTHEDDYFSSDGLTGHEAYGYGTNGRIDFDSSINGFLDTVKLAVNNDKGGKLLKAFTSLDIRDAGRDEGVQKAYLGSGLFGQAKRYVLDASATVTGMGAGSGHVVQNNDGTTDIEKFEIFGGTTGRAMNIDISFRAKTAEESHGNHKGNHDETSIIGHSPLVGNVMRLHGMGIQEATTDGRIKTNPFALEAYYTQHDYDLTYSQDELTELINGCLFLGWLNTSIDGDGSSVSDSDRWVHAVQGNFDNMPDNPNRHHEHGVIGQAIIGTLEDYLNGTVTSIAGLSKESGQMRVGDHGGDPDTNVVWAIIDHNSDFAVIPEPSSYALIGGIIGLVVVLLKRRK